MNITSLISRFTKHLPKVLLGACASGLLGSAVYAEAPHIGTVWYILLENRNFTANETSGGAQIYGSAAAPYINSLITPGNANAAQVSYCPAYHNVLSVYDGSGPSIHPSEPNYIWFESGSNLSKLDDNDPYGSGLSVNQIHTFLTANPSYTTQHLTGLLQTAGVTWKAYSEGTNQLNSSSTNANLGGNLTATSADSSAWTVPLASFSGSNASYVNPYNGSTQWNFACKHTGSLFYADTNGTTSLTVANTATTNPEAAYYPPLTNLAADLTNGTCAQFNVITPDQYNDMHTALSAGLTYHGTHYTSDLAQIAQGDNFLSIIVPQIMASSQYTNPSAPGMIVIWTDETEGSNQNNFGHTLTEIIISPVAKGNGYASTLNYTHSSDINTMQKIFQVVANTGSGFLNDAANASNPTPAAMIGSITAPNALAPISGQSSTTPSGYGTGQAYDFADLFQPGVIQTTIPAATVAPSGFVLNRRTNQYTQTLQVSNPLATATTQPIYVEVSHLPSGAILANATGTANGNSYILAANTGLAAGASSTVTLNFTPPTSAAMSDVLTVTRDGNP